MTEAPEKMWVFPKADWFNAGASNVRISSAGAKDVEYTRSDMARAYLADYRAAYEESCEQKDELRAEVARLKAAHGKLWIALADIIECPGAHPNATVRRMAAYAEKALVHDTIADVHPVPRFYKIEVKI
jgi:hypothetical protein